MPVEQDAYNTVAYPGRAYANTHPDRLAVMATLHGLDPAPVDRCRVLEIGCSEGANLIPMAYAIPGSEFVGFDLADLPVARGQQRIQELGLTNIRLFQANLMQLDTETLGRFDYIIAHGLYAWVPEPVRDHLLVLCRECLTSNGIAFVSYNALPGGHLRTMVRDILLHGARGTEDPAQRAGQGLEFLAFLATSFAEDDPLRKLLEQAVDKLQRKNLHVFFHDELGSEYHPASISDFAANAAKHGLRYLSEAELPPPNDPCFQPEMVAVAKSLAGGDPIAEEQTYDFARTRMYRETLLCHARCAASPDLQIEALGRLRLASRAESSPGEETGVHVFTVAGKARMQCQETGTVALMEHLIAAWPRSVPFAELRRFFGEPDAMLDAEFLMLVMHLVVSRVVELHAWASPSSRIAARPRASAVTRQEADMQASATTLLHTSLGVEDPQLRRLLLLLDGTRDREDLLRMLREEYPDMPEATLREGIEPALRFLHRAGVLLSEDFA